MTKSFKTHLYWVCFAIAWVIIDQYTKWLVLHHLVYGKVVPILPCLNFVFIDNHGAAFGMFAHQAGWQILFFIALAVIISIVLFITLFRTSAQAWLRLMALSLILAGAIGNLIDRLTQGSVIDFIQLHLGTLSFAVFNIADACITIGVILLLITCYSTQKSIK